MEKTACITCFDAKANLVCGLCEGSVCKYCAQFIDEDRVSFLAKTPAHLSHTTYCHACFVEKVEPDLVAYDETMTQAKEILVYFKDQGKETRLIKRDEEDRVSVEKCVDREETLMRLAFFAALRGFNAVIDIDLVQTKVRMGTRQTSSYSANGVPAHVHTEKLIRDRSTWSNPN
jgi:hypothetical protein